MVVVAAGDNLAAAIAALTAPAAAVAVADAALTLAADELAALSVCDQLEILRELQRRNLLVEPRHFKIRGSQRQPTDLCKSGVPGTGLVLRGRTLWSHRDYLRCLPIATAAAATRVAAAVTCAAALAVAQSPAAVAKPPTAVAIAAAENDL